MEHSGRVPDLRPRGRGFEPLRRHCIVSLRKNIDPSLVLVQPRKTCPFISERLLMGRKESNQTNKQLVSKCHIDGNLMSWLIYIFWHKIMIIFLSICLNIRIGCSKETVFLIELVLLSTHTMFWLSNMKVNLDLYFLIWKILCECIFKDADHI